jgi:hypothetical protein
LEKPIAKLKMVSIAYANQDEYTRLELFARHQAFAALQAGKVHKYYPCTKLRLISAFRRWDMPSIQATTASVL